MKTMIKTIVPLLTLVVLISGRPVPKGADAANELRTWPTYFDVTVNGVSAGGGCVSQGSGTLCFYWSGGDLESARILVHGSFTILSKNPVDVNDGAHCWNIDIGGDSVYVIMEGYTTATGWQQCGSFWCFSNCNGNSCS